MKLISCLLLALVLTLQGVTQVRRTYSGIDRETFSDNQTDGGLHFLSGVIMASPVAAWHKLTPAQGAIIGGSLGLLMNFSKELADYSAGRQFSTSDLVLGTTGSLLGAIVTYQVRTRLSVKNKEKRPFKW